MASVLRMGTSPLPGSSTSFVSLVLVLGSSEPSSLEIVRACLLGGEPPFWALEVRLRFLDAPLREVGGDAEGLSFSATAVVAAAERVARAMIEWELTPR